MTVQKKKKMLSLTIKELSGVDRPAQAGAKAVIMKRASTGSGKKRTEADIAEMLKRGHAVLTTATDGHSHLVMLQDYDGNDVVSGTTSYQDDHTHPWVMLDDGRIVIGVAEDHSHEQDKESKLAAAIGATGTGETTMKTDAEKAAADLKAAQDENAELKKRAERSEAVAKLNDAARSHFGKLDDAGQTAFLAKSADDQKTEVDAAIAAAEKAAKDEDPVVYKTMDGLELRKSAGEALISIAKSNDELRKENTKLQKQNQDQELRKRAETELAHLPGSVETRVAMLKAVDGIQDETERTAALNALKAQNEAMATAFQSHGVTNIPAAAGSADAEIDAMAKKFRADNPNVTAEQAYAKVLETPEGQRLYAKTVN